MNPFHLLAFLAIAAFGIAAAVLDPYIGVPYLAAMGVVLWTARPLPSQKGTK